MLGEPGRQFSLTRAALNARAQKAIYQSSRSHGNLLSQLTWR
jgi:outer membrane protease